MATISVERFKSLSPAEFFYRNREIAGFSNPVRALYQTVRELVENALDATDSHGILPSIKVVISQESSNDKKTNVYTVTVEDNGIGIPPHHIPNAFGQLLYSSKYILRQTRGMFGLGAKMAVLYGQMTTGKPVEVISSPINSRRIYAFKVLIDIKSNKPIVLFKASYSKNNNWHGTVVKVHVEGDWSRSRSKIYEYLRRTAIIAPYAELVFSDPEGNTIYFQRSTDLMPVPPREVRPHPHGVDIEMLKMMLHTTKTTNLRDFLIKEFQSVGSITADRVLSMAGLDPGLNPRKLNITQIGKLVKVLKEYERFKPPRGDHLSFMGEDIIKTGLKSILKPEFVTAVTRKPSVYEGHAFIIEVGLAYGGEIKPTDKPTLLRYANKIPLLYDEKSDVAYKVIDENIDWSYYGISFPAPLVILVHICSTKIPYKGVGKESIAEVPEIEKEMESALREAVRRLKSYVTMKRREIEEAERAVSIAKYIPEVAYSLSKIVNGVKQEHLEKILLKMLNQKLKRLQLNTLDEVVVAIE